MVSFIFRPSLFRVASSLDLFGKKFWIGVSTFSQLCSWEFRSSGMLRCDVVRVVPDGSKVRNAFLYYLTLEWNTILRNVGNQIYISKYKILHFTLYTDACYVPTLLVFTNLITRHVMINVYYCTFHSTVFPAFWITCYIRMYAKTHTRMTCVGLHINRTID